MVVTSLASTSGNPETRVLNDFSGAADQFAAPGQNFVVTQAVQVLDPGGDSAPTAIETIKICSAAASTLSSRHIAALRIYMDTAFAGSFDPRRSTLLGSKVRPDLEACETFGRVGELFALVPNGSAKLFFVVVDLASDAPDGAALYTIFDATASDGLRGGPSISSGFSSTQGPPVLSNVGLTVWAVSGDHEADLVDETRSITASPGQNVVIQQFSIADPGSAGDTNDDGNATLVRSVFVQADLIDTTIDLDPSLGLIKRVRLFRESSRTGPGWQEGDDVLGEVVHPDLESGVTFGQGGRLLVRVGRRAVERFYVVVELASSGFPSGNGPAQLHTQVMVGVRDDGNEESSGIETPMPVLASGMITIATRAPTVRVSSTSLMPEFRPNLDLMISIDSSGSMKLVQECDIWEGCHYVPDTGNDPCPGDEDEDGTRGDEGDKDDQMSDQPCNKEPAKRVQASLLVVDNLDRSKDHVGALSWDDPEDGHAVDFLVPLTADFQQVKNQLERVDAWGGTNLNIGLGEAVQELLSPRARPGALKGIIFLTDGYHTDPNEDLKWCDEPGPCKDAKDNGIIVCTVGLGNYDRQWLETVARETGGMHIPLEGDGGPENIIPAFQDCLIYILATKAGKTVISIHDVPGSGMGDLEGSLEFNRAVTNVRKIRALGPYMLDEFRIDNENGKVDFVLTLKSGQQPLTSGPVLEVELGLATAARRCAATNLELDARTLVMTDANGEELFPNLILGRARYELMAGDVTLDGVINRRDSRAAAKLVGKTPSDFPSDNQAALRFAAADVASPFGEITATDVRYIREAVAGRRTLPTSACDRLGYWATTSTSSQALTNMLVLQSITAQMRGQSLEFTVQGVGIAETVIELFTLAGTRIRQAAERGQSVTLTLADERGRILANGVYLYVVTVRGWDGRELHSTVRKLVVLR